MAQPPSYERQKNFADDFGNETDHSALNAELDRASNSINDIRTNLALIQADDGKIRASSITTDSLDQEVLDYVQEKALAGANAVADAATAIANSASEKADQAVQTANASNEIAGNADSKADSAIETANVASANADTAAGVVVNDVHAELLRNEADRHECAITDDLRRHVSLDDEAVRIANAASTTASNADSKSDSAVETANTAKETAQAASANATTAVNTANSADGKADQALSETAQIDSKVTAAVDEALHDAIIPGLTPETIAGALGYIPYDAETNNKDFAASAEVGQAIQQAVDAIPEQVNADWNATSGAAEILNKPTAMTGATAETAGEQGFVPAPQAGDQNKVLKGDGTWGTIASRNIGETVFSLLPLTDAGLHLLDGSLLQVGGIYDTFITYVAALQTDYPGLFVTESEWQESVESYGVCGKFVYTEGVSLRIPKITGFVEGTLDATELGNLIEAGLPNITGYSNIAGVASKASPAAGCLEQNRFSLNYDYQAIQSSVNDFATVSINAALSNPIYGNSDTVQPQAIKGYLYMVVATSAKTDIEVDIDQIATDLNGKAGVDLANVNAAGKAVIANLGMPSNSAVALTIPSSGSSITAPADGYINFTGTAGDQPGSVNLYSETVGSMVSMPAGYAGKALLPVREGAIVNITYTNLHSSTLYFVYAEGSRPV
mgnify:CR=1 FL=1